MAPRKAPFPKELVEFEARMQAEQRAIYSTTPWIVAATTLDAAEGGAKRLLELGASSAVALGGYGPSKDWDDDARIHPVTLLGPTDEAPPRFLASFRLVDTATSAVGPDIQSRIDEWDPTRSARAMVDFTLSDDPVARRPTFGARRKAWDRFDDKLAVQAVWEAAGIDVAPSAVVSLRDERRLVTMSEQLATPLGTVWAVDNAEGWHGGADGTAWVPNPAAIPALRERWSGHEQVRIQPFLEGIPCSIHGMVLADRTLAFRPCEMVVLRDEATASLVYCRSATYWDPPRVDRTRMRAAAIAVGNQLRAEADFRGVFTLDGVMTIDGFRPTEINPRYGAALPTRLPCEDGSSVSVFFAHLAVVAGAYDHLDGDQFERWVLFRLDQHRNGRCFLPVQAAPSASQVIRVDVNGTLLEPSSLDDIAPGTRPSELDAETAATVTWSPGGFGGGGLFNLDFGDAMPVGFSVAPLVAKAFAAAGAWWEVPVPQLSPAVDVDRAASTAKTAGTRR